MVLMYCRLVTLCNFNSLLLVLRAIKRPAHGQLRKMVWSRASYIPISEFLGSVLIPKLVNGKLPWFGTKVGTLLKIRPTRNFFSPEVLNKRKEQLVDIIQQTDNLSQPLIPTSNLNPPLAQTVIYKPAWLCSCAQPEWKCECQPCFTTGNTCRLWLLLVTSC